MLLPLLFTRDAKNTIRLLVVENGKNNTFGILNMILVVKKWIIKKFAKAFPLSCLVEIAKRIPWEGI